MKVNVLRIVILISISYILLAATVDLDNLFNYANQAVPTYITKDNTADNEIDDKIATLGRVLFYDTKLSNNETVSCASCHQQENAFSDLAIRSAGLNGELTGRHSMRLVNSRFSDEIRFFWDERAATLEEQTTQPIQDHIEMGYSGTNGDPDFQDLIDYLESFSYYQQLFTFAYGDAIITEERMQMALAQFIRSIQSFDSRFDVGLSQTNDLNVDFPNYSPLENQGKSLFVNPRALGGVGCAGCHRPPEFDIDPESLNNGIIGVAGDPNTIDLTNTRAPSLRDVLRSDGTSNGPFMHDGSLPTISDVIEHYNAIPNNPENTNLDPRLLGPGGQPQNLNLTVIEKQALEVFLQTLSGNDIYNNEKWSNPFDPDGSIKVVGGTLGVGNSNEAIGVTVYPNPVSKRLFIEIPNGNYGLILTDVTGRIVQQTSIKETISLNVDTLPTGLYFVTVKDELRNLSVTKKIIKN